MCFTANVDKASGPVPRIANYLPLQSPSVYRTAFPSILRYGKMDSFHRHTLCL